MKNGFLILMMMSVAFVTSCKKDNNIVITEMAEVSLNKNIDSTVISGHIMYTIVPGNRTVFKYFHSWEDTTPGLIDAYTSYTVAFALDLSPSQMSFELTNDQIRQAPAFYTYFTGAGTTTWTLLSKGKITGSKINNTTWYIVMHLELPNSPVDVAKNFTIK